MFDMQQKLSLRDTAKLKKKLKNSIGKKKQLKNQFISLTHDDDLKYL